MPRLHCFLKTGWMIYLILTVICAVFFNLLSLVNIQSLAVGFGGLLMEALAKSAEKPYAEIAHSQKKHGNIMLRQWDENL